MIEIALRFNFGGGISEYVVKHRGGTTTVRVMHMHGRTWEVHPVDLQTLRDQGMLPSDVRNVMEKVVDIAEGLL